jgi:glycosyltransferase involved in cell wall biosynthesis
VSVPNGVDPYFQPDESARSTDPLLVCVGRQAPVKRFDTMIEAAIVAKQSIPDLSMVLVGDGPLEGDLRRLVAVRRAGDWITFFGHASRRDLLALYRRAWVVGSASLAEGWGLTLTEAAGCGTPAVATDINGHRCSVLDGTTGLLAPVDGLGQALVRVFQDGDLRRRLGRAALARARTLTWDASALGITRALVSEVRRHG